MTKLEYCENNRNDLAGECALTLRQTRTQYHLEKHLAHGIMAANGLKMEAAVEVAYLSLHV